MRYIDEDGWDGHLNISVCIGKIDTILAIWDNLQLIPSKLDHCLKVAIDLEAISLCKVMRNWRMVRCLLEVDRNPINNSLESLAY